MTVRDWVRYSATKLREDGVSGGREAIAEGVRSLRRRLRRFHILTPSSRTIVIGEAALEFRQRTQAEWDHIQAIRNERAVIEDAMERVEAEDVVWDIGANVGSWTCFLGTTDAEIIAFEPIQANQKALLENITRNKLDALVLPFALTNETGYASMVVDSRGATPGAGRSSLVGSWEGAGDSKVVVPVYRGNELADIPDPSVVKIDVEGAELRVLQGLGELLDSVRVIYVETHGANFEEIRDILDDAGMTVTSHPDEMGAGMFRAER